MSIIDFSDRIEDLTREFTGREWLDERVTRFLNDSTARYLVITGEAGIGKSAVAAHLATTRPVHAIHFCSTRVAETITPTDFVHSINAQLRANLPGFTACVATELGVANYPLSPSITGTATTHHAQDVDEIIGVKIDALYIGSTNTLDLFTRLVTKPLAVWLRTNSNQPVLLLVDALDEGNRYTQSPKIVDLIAASEGLSPSVKWILTSRPGTRAQTMKAMHEAILDDADDNIQDIAKHIRRVFSTKPLAEAATANPARAAALAKALEQHARGNFLYLRYVIKEIRRAVSSGESLPEPSRLPDGLPEVYREFLGRITDTQSDFWKQQLRKVLGTLAAALSPLTFDQVAVMSGVDEQTANDVLSAIAQFLNMRSNKGEELYSIFHASFADFLNNRRSSSEWWINPINAQEQIANYYIHLYLKSDWMLCDDYGIIHLPQHLRASCKFDELRALLIDYNWIRAKVERGYVMELIANYDLVKDRDAVLQTIQSAIRLSSHVIASDPKQLPSQLTGGRLPYPTNNKDIQSIIMKIEYITDYSWLRPIFPYFSSADGPEKMLLAGHSDSVMSVNIHHEMELIISASRDMTICVWNMKTGVLLQTITGHTGAIMSLATIPNSRFLFSGSEDNTLRLWDLNNGENLNIFYGHSETVRCIAVTPDGTKVVSGSHDNTIRIWNLNTGKQLMVLTGHKDHVMAIAINREGSFIASASMDDTLRIWNLNTGKQINIYKGNMRGILSISITHDSNYIIAGGRNGSFEWSIKTGEKRKTPANSYNWIRSIIVTPNGQTIISGLGDNTIMVWGLHEDQAKNTLQGHTEGISTLAISQDGNALVSGSIDSTVRVWDLTLIKDASETNPISLPAHIFAISPDGSQLITSHFLDGNLYIWDTETGILLNRISPSLTSIDEFLVTPDGEVLVLASFDGTLSAWSFITKQTTYIFKGHTKSINCLTISHDGNWIISGSNDNTIRLWDINTGKSLTTFKGHTDWIGAVTISADGQLIASGSNDCTVRIWSTRTGKTVRILNGHAERVVALAMSTDKKILISGSWDNTVRIWDIETGSVLKTLKGHTDGVNTVVLRENENQIISGANDKKLIVWNLKTADQITSMTANGGITSCVVTNKNIIVFNDAGERVGFLQLQEQKL